MEKLTFCHLYQEIGRYFVYLYVFYCKMYAVCSQFFLRQKIINCVCEHIGVNGMVKAAHFTICTRSSVSKILKHSPHGIFNFVFIALVSAAHVAHAAISVAFLAEIVQQLYASAFRVASDVGYHCLRAFIHFLYSPLIYIIRYRYMFGHFP